MAKRKKYIEDTDLLYELILSKGKGTPTDKLGKMFILIADNVMNKMLHRYSCDDLMYDCHTYGLLSLFEKWKNFDEKRFDKALPYITEIYKRGLMFGWNKINGKKSYNDDYLRTISLTNFNNYRL
jgi:hypothetical protein